MKHTGIKPYHCDQCNESFSQSRHLAVHKRTHAGMKPFHCDQCDKSFSQSGHLAKHKRTHTGVKPYSCDQCDKLFSNRCTLIRHKKIHTTTKLYYCYQSNKSSSKFGTLSNGQRSQFVDKPNPSCSLATHRKKSHVKEMFSCDHCDKWFELLSDLNRHVQANLFSLT